MLHIFTRLRPLLNPYTVTLVALGLMMLLLAAAMSVRRAERPEAVFSYRALSGEPVRGGMVVYQPDVAVVCPTDALAWHVALTIDRVPTQIVIRGALRNAETGRTWAAFDLNKAISQGRIESPIPYAQPRSFADVPLSMPLSPYALPPGRYVLEVVAGDQVGEYSGFSVPFEVITDGC